MGNPIQFRHNIDVDAPRHRGCTKNRFELSSARSFVACQHFVIGRLQRALRQQFIIARDLAVRFKRAALQIRNLVGNHIVEKVQVGRNALGTRIFSRILNRLEGTVQPLTVMAPHLFNQHVID